jgi:tRNA pseudouridine32 synthase/23S rRNA pseudouridine746 synthase
MTVTTSSLELIYSDEAVLVANKPAGLLAVPGKGADKQDCFSLRLQHDYPDALIVHRLDMATSGLMVFARGIEMQRRLSHLFHERQIDKRYVAIVSGQLKPSGEINLSIAANWPNRPMRKIDHISGKPSLTCYHLLAYDSSGNTSRVELIPITGRTHQLRLHLSAIGHPILGDALYGKAASAPRLLLHACALNFAHPLSGDILHFTSPPPF